jgi:hypothetical protein
MKYTLLILLFGFTLVACDKDDDPKTSDCDTTDVTYTNTIAAIFDSSCAIAGCHVNGNEQSTLYSLEGYENAKSSAGFGRIEGSINHEEGFSPMPKDASKLSACDIDKIEAWINAGYPE